MTEVEFSIIVKNYVTVFGVVIAGSWAIWKWEFLKWKEKKNSIYSIDGEISTTNKPNKDETIITKISSIWRNKGDINIELEPKLVQIYVYEFSKELELGLVDFNTSFGEPVYKLYPYSHLSKFTLGKNTESEMELYLSLGKNKQYAVSWKLYKKSNKRSDPAYFVERGIIFNTFQ